MEDREVVFTIPTTNAGGNPILLTYDSDFGMGISHRNEDWVLVSGVENSVSGVSIDIQQFEPAYSLIGYGTVKKLQIYFAGIMTFVNEMNQHEQHTVEGKLYYTKP